MTKFALSDHLIRCRKPLALFLTGLACESAFAQSAPPAFPKPAGSANLKPPASAVDTAKTSPTASTPATGAKPPAMSGNSAQANDPDAQKKFAALSEALKERIGLAANKVMLPLLRAEGNLYNRFNYFQKPERLNPDTFNSKDEVIAWKDSLKQFRGDEDVVEKLYANVSDNLENALIAQRIDAQLAASIKQQLVSSIPWEIVQKKEKLIGEFIENHGKLLNFYEANWRSWKPGNRPGVPEFDDLTLAGTYQQLREKITTSGQQIVQLYAKLKE